MIDGDRLGHEALKSPEVKTLLRERFSDAAFDSQGEVDRSKLGRLVFGSDLTQQQARADLEQIVHPRIRESIARVVSQSRQRPEVEAIILDAAILLEAGWDDLCDTIVFIDVPFKKRLQRVQTGRGWSEVQLNLRESSQLPLSTKRESADYVIDNFGTLAEAATDFERVLSRITSTERHLP